MATNQSKKYPQTIKQPQNTQKRAAPYSINQKTLQAIDYHQSTDPVLKLAQSDHTDRNILKIKKQDAEHKGENITITTDEKAVPVIQNQVKPQKNELPSETKPNTQKAAPNLKKPGSLFAELFKTKQGCAIFAKMGLFAGINRTHKDQKIPNCPNKDNKFMLPPLPKKIKHKSDPFFKFNRGRKIPSFQNRNIQQEKVVENQVKVQATNQEEEEGDSAELQKDQHMLIDKSKSKGSYKYVQQVTVVISSAAKKYKRNNGDLIESVQVILQREQSSQIYILIVRLEATKHNIFSGIIVPGKSLLRVLNGKDQNLSISAFLLNQGKILQKNELKIQFQTAEQGKLFYSKLQMAVNSQYKVKQQHVQQKEGQYIVKQ